MTLAEMLQRMSSAEFASWMAFDRIQPIGNRRIDLNFARLCAVVAASASASGTSVQPSRFDVFDDFKSTVGQTARRTMDQQKRTAIKITRMLGGKVTGVDHADDRKP